MFSRKTRTIFRVLAMSALGNLIALPVVLKIEHYHFIVRHRDVAVQLAPEKRVDEIKVGSCFLA
jgi:integral membrane sensor domain MASE1